MDAYFDVGHGFDGLHRELAEEREGEVLQEVVAKDADPRRLQPSLSGSAPKMMLDWWPHL